MSGWFDEEPTGEESAGEESADGRGDPGEGSTGGADPGSAGGWSEPSTEEDRARERARAEDRFERYRVKGDELLSRVKEIVHEGNVRRITIRNEGDRVLLSFPLTAGVVGVALAPVWAGVAAVAALVGKCSIEVERRE